jgi:sugar transferase (PEP-CTERM/EpsH1 system associated)
LRILYFCPQQIWPVNSGSRLRNVHLATALARHFSVTLLRILQPDDPDEVPAEAALFEDFLAVRKGPSYGPGAIVKGMLGPVPLTVLNYKSKDVAGCLRSALNSKPFDAVQMETTNLFSYLDVIRSAPNQPAVVLDWHNIDSELMARYSSEAAGLPKKLIALRTATLLHKLEGKLMNLCDAHTVVSEVDKQKLLIHNPAANVTVIPNGVDSVRFSPSTVPSSECSLLFVGSMDYHANADSVRWFAQTVWPEMSRRFPSLKFNIVGRSPGRNIQLLASDKIRVTGTVDDVRPFYADALAVIVPLRVGGGTRLKILEAMAMGVPVIATTLGAEGVAAIDGQEILLADSEEEMIGAVARIMTDAQFRRELTVRARQLVAEQYDWTSIGQRLQMVYLDLLKSRRDS